MQLNYRAQKASKSKVDMLDQGFPTLLFIIKLHFAINVNIREMVVGKLSKKKYN